MFLEAQHGRYLGFLLSLLSVLWTRIARWCQMWCQCPGLWKWWSDIVLYCNKIPLFMYCRIFTTKRQNDYRILLLFVFSNSNEV